MSRGMTVVRSAPEWIESTRGDYWITEWRENNRQWEISTHKNGATLSVRWHPTSPFTRVGERTSADDLHARSGDRLLLACHAGTTPTELSARPGCISATHLISASASVRPLETPEPPHPTVRSGGAVIPR